MLFACTMYDGYADVVVELSPATGSKVEASLPIFTTPKFTLLRHNSDRAMACLDIPSDARQGQA